MYLNTLSLALTALGVFFDTLVWYYSGSLDLYGEDETKNDKAIEREKNAHHVQPLLTNSEKA